MNYIQDYLYQIIATAIALVVFIALRILLITKTLIYADQLHQTFRDYSHRIGGRLFALWVASL